MEKLSEIREKIKFNEDEINKLADILQDLKNPFNRDMPMQFSFGHTRSEGFDIEVPEIIVVPLLNPQAQEYYELSRKFYLTVKQADLKCCQDNIKRLKAKEKEIMDSLLETEEPKMLK